MNHLGKSKFIRWFLLAVLFVLFLLPGETEQIVNESNYKPVYDFSMQVYKNNIIGYIDLLKTDHSLGLSKYDVPVSEELFHYFSRSFKILFPAFFLSIILGMAKGIFDYYFSERKWNVIGNGTTWLGQSLPDFFFAISIQYGLLLLIRIGFPHIDLFGYDHWYNVFFPIFFLSMYPLFYIARITSAALAYESNKNYVRTARALGASTRTVLLRHMLKNAMYTILSHFFTVMVLLLGSLPIVEFLTFYRGAGRRLIEAFGINPGIPGPTLLGIESTTAIGFMVVFLLFLFLALWISNLLKAFVIPTNSINVREVITSFILFIFIAIVLILIILLPTDIKIIPISMVTRVFGLVIL
jgi:oligopeptide transport system permease protein